ncbi:hypothetical protein BGX28_001723, partial [Mortierella sp. GBA30]
MAIVAVAATVSAAPVAEPVEVLAAGFPVPDGYAFCTTRPNDYMSCYNYCGRKGYWW